MKSKSTKNNRTKKPTKEKVEIIKEKDGYVLMWYVGIMLVLAGFLVGLYDNVFSEYEIITMITGTIIMMIYGITNVMEGDNND